MKHANKVKMEIKALQRAVLVYKKDPKTASKMLRDMYCRLSDLFMSGDIERYNDLNGINLNPEHCIFIAMNEVGLFSEYLQSNYKKDDNYEYKIKEFIFNIADGLGKSLIFWDKNYGGWVIYGDNDALRREVRNIKVE